MMRKYSKTSYRKQKCSWYGPVVLRTSQLVRKSLTKMTSRRWKQSQIWGPCPPLSP